VLEVKNRDEPAVKMNENGIECKPYFPPVHLQIPYRALGFREGDFHLCEEISSLVSALLFFTQMSRQEVESVVSALATCERDLKLGFNSI
jgi:perosamine synthetase